MKVSEICKLIEICAKHGVKDLEIGDLKVRFDNTNLTDELYDLNNSTRSVPSDSLQGDPALSQEEELGRLLLTDPLAYEEAVETE